MIRLLLAVLMGGFLMSAAHATHVGMMPNVPLSEATAEDFPGMRPFVLAGEWRTGDAVKIEAGCLSRAAAVFLADAWEADETAVAIAYRVLTRGGNCGRFPKPVPATLVEPVHAFVDYRGKAGTVWKMEALGNTVFVLVPDGAGPHEPV